TATATATPDIDLHGEFAIVVATLADPRAFAPLYERYFPLIHGYCLRRLGHPENAADATSQIFINAIQALPKFRPDLQRPGSSFRSWLFAIAHNVVVDHYRRTRPHLSLDAPATRGDDLDLDSRDVPDTDPTPEEYAVATESRDYLASLLNQLPERQAAVAELRLAGFTNAEVAEALRISYPAVRSAQYRAFLALRELLESPTASTGDRT
ncbi:MAG TPA: sigma-70 family RNA polymerase sigma factor, partial [Thermomicrobiales bacterium]|nr:sigma-70 family RNA polymerase sigma factor [Thermomicrobiales bacterium]